MLCLSGFELYSRWVPLNCVLYDRIANDNISHTCLKMVLSTYFRLSFPRIVFSPQLHDRSMHFSCSFWLSTLMSPCLGLTRTVLSTRFSFSFLAVIDYQKGLKRLIKCSFVRAQIAKMCSVWLANISYIVMTISVLQHSEKVLIYDCEK